MEKRCPVGSPNQGRQFGRLLRSSTNGTAVLLAAAYLLVSMVMDSERPLSVQL